MCVEHALLATVIDRPLPKQLGMISNDRTNTLADRRNQPVRRSFLSADDVCSTLRGCSQRIVREDSSAAAAATTILQVSTNENKQMLFRVTCVVSGLVIAEVRFVVQGTHWLCDAAARAARRETRLP